MSRHLLFVRCTNSAAGRFARYTSLSGAFRVMHPDHPEDLHGGHMAPFPAPPYGEVDNAGQHED